MKFLRTTTPMGKENIGGFAKVANPHLVVGRYLDKYDVYKYVTIDGHRYKLITWLGNINDSILCQETGLDSSVIRKMRQELGIGPCTSCALTKKNKHQLDNLTRQMTCSVVQELLRYGRPQGLDSHLSTLKNRHALSLRSQQLSS